MLCKSCMNKVMRNIFGSARKSPKKKVKGNTDYHSYSQIPAAKKAWITIRAEQQGKNPVMAHAGVKAAITRKRNGN